MDRVQLPEGSRGNRRKQFTFNHKFVRTSCYSFNQTWKDERMDLLVPSDALIMIRMLLTYLSTNTLKFPPMADIQGSSF